MFFVALPHPLMEGESFKVEARWLFRARMYPRNTNFGSDVEKNGRIRHRPFKNDVGDRPVECHELGAFAAVYLIGDRGKREAVGDDGLTAFECRANYFGDHLRA